jgi:hypothetical protein
MPRLNGSDQVGIGIAELAVMTKLRIGAAAVLLTATVFGSFSGCGSDVVATDCRVKCDEAHNTCVKSCKDNACTTKCTTDLDGCKASCGEVVVKDGG